MKTEQLKLNLPTKTKYQLLAEKWLPRIRAKITVDLKDNYKIII